MQFDDAFSFYGPPTMCCNAWLALRMSESLYPNQCANEKSEVVIMVLEVLQMCYDDLDKL